MSRAITVGLDGSPESLAAAEWAACEALRRGIPLQLLHVWTAVELQYGREPVLREAAESLQSRYPDLRITTGHVSGQAAQVLAAAETELLVLGSRGLSGAAGFLVGSVALAAVARSTHPVVLVRAEKEAANGHQPDDDAPASAVTLCRDVVLGLDITRPAPELLEFAFKAASLRGAVLRVVHSWPQPSTYGLAVALDPSDLAKSEAEALTEALHAWREKFPEVEVQEQSMAGSAADHLAGTADASLIVVGRRMRHNPLGTHIGPVVHAVLHHSTFPVAVVPHK
jgi:nucleotide-binding universal stress UspA family protein